MAILQTVRLRKKFGQLVAVSDIDLSIEEGELRGLIGPNGSGKTTLFNLITGFLRPEKGKVIWQGQDITKLSPHARAERGLVRTFQITTMFKEMTALQNVVLACHLHTGMRPLKQFFRGPRIRKMEKAVEERALDLLETMGISHVKDELAGGLPHGYQEALALAMATATEPKLLLLDEPVTGMNPVETSEIMQRIKRLNERGVTILVVDHDMRAIMGTCRKITVMNFGEKIAEGLPEEVSKNEAVMEAYLGVR